MLERVLKWALVIALFIEVLFPRASWSAWALVSFPVASFVMASGVIAMVNADFLARCDVLSHRPVTTFLGSIISVVALSVISIKRLRH